MCVLAAVVSGRSIRQNLFGASPHGKSFIFSGGLLKAQMMLTKHFKQQNSSWQGLPHGEIENCALYTQYDMVFRGLQQMRAQSKRPQIQECWLWAEAASYGGLGLLIKARAYKRGLELYITARRHSCVHNASIRPRIASTFLFLCTNDLGHMFTFPERV